MSGLTIETVTGADSSAHFVSTATVNWVILRSGDGVTLIDGGYPGHAGAVIESLRRVGSDLVEIRAALLTHAHVDHLGGLVRLRREYDFPVYADPHELGHARRDYLQQANVATLAPIAWKPRVVRWLTRILPLGALDRTGLPDAASFPDLTALPGAPVAVPAPGHTDGHSAFVVCDGEVLVSGDALITAHETSSHDGPQCLGGEFTHDIARNAESLRGLRDLPATVLMPGHGPLLRGPVRAAIDRAL